MSSDSHRCEPVVDAGGNVIALARVSPDLDAEGRRHLLAIAEAAIRFQAAQDAADPVGAAERARRQEAMRARKRARRGE